MHDWWALLPIALAFALGYGFAPLVRRAKQDSPRWQQRTEAGRQWLSVLPGYLAGFALAVVILLIFDH